MADSKEYIRRWRIDNADRLKLYHKQWRLDHPNHIRQWRKEHPDYDKQWKGRDQLNYNKKRAAYVLRYRKSNVTAALTKRLCDRLRNALNGNFKHCSAVNDLGCSIDDFKRHIESKFQPGMTWGNRKEWNLDHIVPLSKFNLQDKTQVLIAFHYTNYQPLWKSHNFSKGDLSVMDFRDGMF